MPCAHPHPEGPGQSQVGEIVDIASQPRKFLTDRLRATAVRGCRRRLDEDCVAVYANALNFWGEAHLPGRDRVTAVVDEAG